MSNPRESQLAAFTPVEGKRRGGGLVGIEGRDVKAKEEKMAQKEG